MANISTALSAILDTITTAATSATSIVNTAGKGVAALDNYATKALAKQEVASELDLHNFFETILDEKKLELSNHQTMLDEVLRGNSELKANFDKADAILRPTYERIQAKYFPKA